LFYKGEPQFVFAHLTNRLSSAIEYGDATASPCKNFLSKIG